MIKFYLSFLFSSFLFSHLFFAQGIISGRVSADGEIVEFARVSVYPISNHTLTNAKGTFLFEDISFGTYIVEASAIGFKSTSDSISISASSPFIDMNIKFTDRVMELDAIVVSGTKT